MNRTAPKPICWCGNQNLSAFSNDYLLCESCRTLVLRQWPEEQAFLVRQDEQGFYGKSYWFDHQEDDLQFGNIIKRARTDIPERILYWLQTLLKYKIPPGTTLELGCSHGGFVSTLQWTGFQASGLELSPWVVDFARRTFHIHMYQGKLEDQKVEASSLDAVILMDVLEHLPDPASTIAAAVTLLKKDGILLIQTPCYQERHSFEKMQKENDPFLKMLQAPEHVYLFSQSSVRQLLNRCNLPFIQFEHAYFGMYDMFLVASQSPLTVHTPEAIDEALTSTPGGRLVLALLDKDAKCKDLYSRLYESENDRAARLDQIHQYDAWLKEARAELQECHETQKEFKGSFLYKIGRRVGMF